MREIAKILHKYSDTSKYKQGFIGQYIAQGVIQDKTISLLFCTVPDPLLFRVDQINTDFIESNKKKHSKTFFKKLTDFCSSFNLNPSLTDNAVGKLANECSLICEKLSKQSSALENIIIEIENELAVLDVPSRKGKSLKGDIARYCCNRWWNRKLSVIHKRNFEHIAQFLGQVNKQRNIYLSEYALNKIQQKKKSRNTFLETLLAINEQGDQHELVDFVESSLSCATNKISELLMRMVGTAQYAENKAYDAHLVTFLCPIEMKSSFDYGEMNDEYIKNSTLEAHKYLMKSWKNTRSALDKKEKDYFGFRVVEPCHDGSPHWHLLIYTSPQKSKFILEFLKERMEKGYKFKNKKLQCSVQLEPIPNNDVAKVIKYLTKGIEGKINESDTKSEVA